MIEMGKILIKHVILDGKKKDIFINGDKIETIADTLEAKGDEEVIDAQWKHVIPGFVNMHTHSAMTLMRGVEEDTPLQQWLQRIWAIEPHLTDEMIYWGTKLAVLEMIKSGTTSFLDMYWRNSVSEKAASEMGIRGNYSYVFLDNFDREKARKCIKECEENYEISSNWGTLSRFDIAVHADYTVSESSIRWAIDFARSHNLKFHIHLSETEHEVLEDENKLGMSPVQHFESLGALGPDVIAAHCVWISENDIRVLGRRGVSVVHNINSNLKLSSGYKFKYEELKAAGANVCLGTDGAASNNNLDMLESIKTMALLQKAWRKRPDAMPLKDLMDISTYNGAKALGIKTGKVEEGYLADLVLIDAHSSAFVPDFNFIANLFYAANSSCVDTVICNGKVIMRDRKVDGEDEILHRSEELAEKLIKMQ